MNTTFSTSDPVTKATTAPVSVAPAISLNMVHDLQHQIGLVREALLSEKRRLGFFLGAGCSLGIYDDAEAKSAKHIRDVAGLTSGKIHRSVVARAGGRKREVKYRILLISLGLSVRLGAGDNPLLSFDGGA